MSALQMALGPSKRTPELRVCGSARNAIGMASDADRHVHREQPGPGRDRQDPRRHRRADRRGDGADRRVEPDAAPEPAARIDEAHQRAVDAHDAGRAEALDDPGDGQRQQRIRQRAAERGDGEDDQPVLIDAAIAVDVAERGQRQQRYRHGKLVGVHHPDRRRGAGVEIARDRRQRHIGDRAVQHRERQAECDGQDRPIALRKWNAVVARQDGVAAPADPPSAGGQRGRRQHCRSTASITVATSSVGEIGPSQHAHGRRRVAHTAPGRNRARTARPRGSRRRRSGASARCRCRSRFGRRARGW